MCVAILHAKFRLCIARSFLIFEDDVFDQTVEQYMSLLKTKAEIISSNVLLSKQFSTLLICHSLAMHEETVLLMCASEVR